MPYGIFSSALIYRPEFNWEKRLREKSSPRWDLLDCMIKYEEVGQFKVTTDCAGTYPKFFVRLKNKQLRDLNDYASLCV
jgi:hypothetical protein